MYLMYFLKEIQELLYSIGQLFFYNVRLHACKEASFRKIDMVLKRTFSFNEETISTLFFSVFFGGLLGRAAVDLFIQGARSCPEMFSCV